MASKKRSMQAIGYTLVFLLISACSTSQPANAPTATAPPEVTIAPTQPPPTPTEEVEEWTYVALGDSTAVCCESRPYPTYYAEFIEQDLNVKVNLINLGIGSSTSTDLLESLTKSDYYRSYISKAQVITIVITANDLNLSCPGYEQACVDEQFVTAGQNFTAIIKEILSLASPEDTIIRTQTYFNPYVNTFIAEGTFDEMNALLDRWNQQIIDIATQYNIPVADVYKDFNGPNGDQDPGDKGYLYSDGRHANNAGALRMAELLRELGYEPLSP